MLRRKNCAWLLVAAAFWTGCAFSPLGSNRAVSPVSVPIDYEGLARLSVSDEGMTAPQTLSITEAETLWGQLAAENPELARQSAGEEIVIRHVYGEEKTASWGEMNDGQKIILLGMLAVAGLMMVWLMNGAPMGY